MRSAKFKWQLLSTRQKEIKNNKVRPTIDSIYSIAQSNGGNKLNKYYMEQKQKDKDSYCLEGKKCG